MPDPDIEAVERLLTWMRGNGFACDTLTIGAVKLTGLRDYRPPPDVEVSAAAAAERSVVAEESIYDVAGRDLAGYERMRGQVPG